MQASPSNLLVLIPLLPLVGAILNGVLGRRFLKPAAVHTIACGAMAGAALLSWAVFFQLVGMEPEGRALSQEVFAWIRIGSFHADYALWVDPLSAVMCLIITNIGFLIHLYSVGYMQGDPSYYRFFAYLNLFVFAMLNLVMGDNLLVMFFGWEGVGLCSYLLIGFWFSEEANAVAGKKAFVTNRVGDFGFALGTMLLFAALGTVGFQEINHQLAGAAPPSKGLLEAAALLLFLGACGKSAQIPLYVWLPDAMAGPTPVSALIHAATMVTAGVYMIARLNGLYFHAELASQVVLWIGAATALFAATIGLVQNDIKKVLAYSTVSQLGFMFVAMGAGAYATGMFHLMTHAFFKACLFLGSGSVIMAMHHEQDMRYYGGLRKFMPWTYRTFLVATLAIAGVPFFAGFFSKDEILLWALGSERGHAGAWLLASAAALCTAFYMFRILHMTFWGEYRGLPPERLHAHGHDDHGGGGHGGDGGHGHGGGAFVPKESPWTVTVPLVVLAALSAVGGFLGLPAGLLGHHANLLEGWYEPIFAHSHVSLQHAFHNPGAEAGLMALSVAVAAAGIALSFYLYRTRPALPGELAKRFAVPYRVLLQKYSVDEAYEAGIIRPILVGSREVLWKVVDVVAIDGLVNLVGGGLKALGRGLGRLQTGDAQVYAMWMTGGLTVAVLVTIAIL
ncbi:NADH-quinone oxidoreductase subunit L [Myxococcota bacterium]|nr:NADH-quinone oxidoreductase subunit L [Myxococcota bacterium]